MMMVNFHPLHGVLIDGAISLMACKSPQCQSFFSCNCSGTSAHGHE